MTTRKTKGRADTPNKNGYYTAANVDFGDAKLVYEFLDMVNEARVAEGHAPVTWTDLDSMEEYTLLRARELNELYSHERPGSQYGGFTKEVAAEGFGGNTERTFDGWMNSPGHRRTIMEDSNIFMCAAKCNKYWIITFGGSGAPGLLEGGALVDYEKQNGWLTD